MNPILTPDEAERLFISDILTPSAMTFDDFGMKPYSVEETLLKFIKLYLPDEYQSMPLESIVKKVNITQYFLTTSSILINKHIIINLLNLDIKQSQYNSFIKRYLKLNGRQGYFL